MKRAASDSARYFHGLRGPEENAAIALFSNEDILYTMLRDRPRSLLRLLASAKSLYGLLRAVPGFFSAALDSVVMRETGDDAYAFYVCEFHSGHLRELLQYSLSHTPVYISIYLSRQLRDELHLSLSIDAASDHRRLVRAAPWTGNDWVEASEEAFARPIVPYSGNGADIVTSADQRAYTAMCELVQYRFIAEHNDDGNYTGISLGVLPEWMRQHLCVLYTYYYPFALGPFHILDTRRLYLHRLRLTYICEAYRAQRRPLRLYESVELTSYNGDFGDDPTHYGHQVPEDPYTVGFDFITDMADVARRFLAEGEEAMRVWFAIYFGPGADYDVPWLRDDAVWLTDMLAKLRDDVGDSAAFPGTRVLLAQSLPASGEMLVLETYRAQLRALYGDPAVARHALIGELHYIERQYGEAYATLHYGACVQCERVTGTVHAERGVYMCVQCHASNK